MQEVAKSFINEINKFLNFSNNTIRNGLSKLKLDNKNDLNTIFQITRMLRKSQKISNENIRAIYTKIAMLENVVNLFLNKVDIFTFVNADGDILFGD